MTHSVKKIATAKNIPLLALALFAAMFMGSEVLASMRSAAAPSAWVPNPDMTSPNPTNPEHYVPYSGNLATDCEQEEDICGILAEEDPNNPGHPLITEELEGRIIAEDTNSEDVFLLPRAQ